MSQDSFGSKSSSISNQQGAEQNGVATAGTLGRPRWPGPKGAHGEAIEHAHTLRNELTQVHRSACDRVDYLASEIVRLQTTMQRDFGALHTRIQGMRDRVKVALEAYGG
jgi:hypothetical protein